MQWRFIDSAGVEHDGTVERSRDFGGTDAVYTFRANCGAVRVLSGARVKTHAATLNTATPSVCSHAVQR